MAFLAFVALLALTGLMRLAELAVSVARQRAHPDRVVRERGLFAAMAGLHAALVAAPVAEVWVRGVPFSPVQGGVALVLLALATALRVWTLRTLGRAWNVRIVRPDEAQIATGGPYRWVRHPNYLCVILEIAALPLFHGAVGSMVTLSAWNAGVLAVRIRNEEEVLTRIPAWAAAFRAKARLIPGIF